MKTFVPLSISLLASLVPVRANLITNGSFETPLVPVGAFTNSPTGSTGITGWTVVGPQASIVSTSYAAGCCTFPAQDGNQWLDLTGDVTNALEGVQQTVTTIPGIQYTVSFWVGNVNDPTRVFGTASTVRVLLGGISGTLLGNFTNSSTATRLAWQQFSTAFTATGTSTTLDFLNADPSSDNSNGLDNIDLEIGGTSAVPEPSTLALLGLGIVALRVLCLRKVT